MRHEKWRAVKSIGLMVSCGIVDRPRDIVVSCSFVLSYGVIVGIVVALSVYWVVCCGVVFVAVDNSYAHDTTIP